MQTTASRFIDECVRHPDWLRIIERRQASEIIHFADERGFKCSLEELKAAAGELIAGNSTGADAPEAGDLAVDEAAAGLSDLEGEAGYGDDTGYAALFGVAGTILKLK